MNELLNLKVEISNLDLKENTISNLLTSANKVQEEIERLNNGIERINSIYRSMQFSAPENQYIFINQLEEVLKELKGSDE